MSKDRLDITEAHMPSRGLLAIGWFNAEEGFEGDFHLGEALGESGVVGDTPEEEAAEWAAEAEHEACTKAVRDAAYGVRTGGELVWDDMASATKALRVARAKLREVRSKKPPLLEWEQKALAAGWKPPKGRI